MDENKEHTIYTATEIEAYHQGKLPPGQMHSMEKAALNDPFLAEAMEGYAGFVEADWNKKLEGLKEQLANAGSRAKIIAFKRSTARIWKYAAASVIILSGTAITWWFSRNSNKDSLSQQSIAQNIPVAKDSQFAKPATITPYKEEPALVTSDTRIKESNATGKVTVPVSRQNDQAVLSNTGPVNANPKPQEADEAKTKKADNQNGAGNKTDDKVVATISPAPVVLSNKSVRAEAPVRVNSGYEEMKKNKQALHRISLVKIDVADAAPKDGWEKYQAYIDSNFEQPGFAVKKVSHGTVNISFDLDDKDTPTILKTSSVDCIHCMKEAKKLILLGPKWKVINGNKASVRLILQF